MTNYNDGNWHGWNGGECPVHPKSVIQAFYMMSRGAFPMEFKAEASEKIWSAPFIFRVVKEYREPREFWITIFDGMAWDFEEQAEENNKSLGGCAGQIVHVREVTE